MSASGPVLGLDLGTRRIGLAVSDPGTDLALPAGALVRETPAVDLETLAALVCERGVARVVVGLPLHMDGRAGEMAAAARDFAQALAERTGLPVELLDERWTTAEAERSLRESGPRRRGRRAAAARRRGDVDAAAATLLLRTWLARNPAPGRSGAGQEAR